MAGITTHIVNPGMAEMPKFTRVETLVANIPMMTMSRVVAPSRTPTARCRSRFVMGRWWVMAIMVPASAMSTLTMRKAAAVHTTEDRELTVRTRSRVVASPAPSWVRITARMVAVRRKSMTQAKAPRRAARDLRTPFPTTTRTRYAPMKRMMVMVRERFSRRRVRGAGVTVIRPCVGEVFPALATQMVSVSVIPAPYTQR